MATPTPLVEESRLETGETGKSKRAPKNVGVSKTIINFWLDVGLMVAFLFVLWTAFVLRFVFPPGTAAVGWNLWGASYEQWFELQFWSLCTFGLLALVHVMLHWTWVCGVVATKMMRVKKQLTDGERTLVGVGLLVVIFHVLGVAFAAALLTIQSP